jgi:DNA-binding NtrC family response regulator
LNNCPWPGNVRELANTIQKAAIFSRGCPIGPEDIAKAIGGASMARNGAETAPSEAIRRWLRGALAAGEDENLFEIFMDRFAGMIISEVLKVTGGNRSRAAKILGLSRPTLLAKIDKHRIRVETSVSSDTS